MVDLGFDNGGLPGATARIFYENYLIPTTSIEEIPRQAEPDGAIVHRVEDGHDIFPVEKVFPDKMNDGVPDPREEDEVHTPGGGDFVGGGQKKFVSL